MYSKFWKDKLWHIYTIEYYAANKNDHIADRHKSLDDFHGNYAEWRGEIKSFMLYGSTYVMFSKWQNSSDEDQVSDSRG